MGRYDKSRAREIEIPLWRELSCLLWASNVLGDFITFYNVKIELTIQYLITAQHNMNNRR